MSQSTVLQIYIAPAGKAPMQSVQKIHAVTGRGLEGDRYFTGTGTFVKGGHTPASQQASLIEAEAIEALERDDGIKLNPGDSRRNIITRGIALNHLVGMEFTVGEVRLRGIKLCEPCGHLESLTQKGVKNGLIHRGGLRAQVLTDGLIRVGDAIIVAQTEPAAACAS